MIGSLKMIGSSIGSQQRRTAISNTYIIYLLLCMVSLPGCKGKDELADVRLKNIAEIRLLGCEATSSDDVLEDLVANKKFDDSSLEKLPEFTTNFESITSLDLKGSSVKAAALVHLAKLPKIELLDISNLDLKNEGLKNLASLKDVLVSDLYLDNNGIDDAGLKHLEGLSNLKYVSFAGNDDVTEDGIDALKIAIPDLEVEQ